MNQSGKRFLFDLPGRYRIRVQGQLSASWSSRLSDMVITTRQPANQPSVTTLTGDLRDQAALMGVLNALYDMGCPLLKVERLGALPTAEDFEPARRDTLSRRTPDLTDEHTDDNPKKKGGSAIEKAHARLHRNRDLAIAAPDSQEA